MSLPAPSPPRPSGPTLRQSLALVWRTLRSMRTALVLLLLLASASAVGSLPPQIPHRPAPRAAYRIAHPIAGDWFARAGFFDVFGSWWFALILTLLFVSLVACLIPRSRAMVRSIRQRPIQARELDSFPHYRELTVPGEPAEKGALREAGSLVFHWAFVFLLV